MKNVNIHTCQSHSSILMGKSCAKKMTSWWFQPIWKILVKFWNLPQCLGVKIKNIWVATTKMVHMQISPLKKWDSELGNPSFSGVATTQLRLGEVPQEFFLRCKVYFGPRQGPSQQTLQRDLEPKTSRVSQWWKPAWSHEMLMFSRKKLNPNDLNFIWIWIAILGALPKHILIGFLSSKWIHHGLSMPNI